MLALTRQLYNAALKERVEAWRRPVTWQDQCKSFTALRRDPLFTDFRTLDLRIQRAPLRRVDRAFRGFVRHCRAGEAPGFPRRALDLDRDHNAAICILRRAWPAHGQGLADVQPPVATAGPDASRPSSAGGTSVPSSGVLAPLVA